MFYSENKINKTGKASLTFPWWCLFIAYGICLILVGVSILFIIARGIEFGDLKTQKWLTSILSGFFSSILVTQPLKVKFFFYSFCFNEVIRFYVWQFSLLVSVEIRMMIKKQMNI